MSTDEQKLTGANGCCISPGRMPEGVDRKTGRAWNRSYFIAITVLAALWALVYSYIADVSHWFVFETLGFAAGSHAGLSLEFFIYDTVKILLLLVALIYVIALARASLNVERVRDYLAARHPGLGYFLGAVFGSVTPFCSCSSIPVFLGFTTARIPIGITMSFLITSPLINEIAVVLLWGLLGFKFTVIYIAVGMSAGMLGGFFMDRIRAGRWLQPFILETMNKAPAHLYGNEIGKPQKLTVKQRHVFAYGETAVIFKRIWKWVFVGVGIGAVLHGFVPDNWFAENLGAGEWWSVPVSTLAAIPLYSNVTGIIPVMESLLVKGLPIGTTMAFCMSAVAASIPEVIMLRQIMTIKLQAAFIGYLWVIFTLVGWLFNFIGPYLV